MGGQHLEKFKFVHPSRAQHDDTEPGRGLHIPALSARCHMLGSWKFQGENGHQGHLGEHEPSERPLRRRHRQGGLSPGTER